MFILILLSCLYVGAQICLLLPGFAVNILLNFQTAPTWHTYSCHPIPFISIFQVTFLKVCTLISLTWVYCPTITPTPTTSPLKDAVRLSCIPFSLRIPGYFLPSASWHLYIYIYIYFRTLLCIFMRFPVIHPLKSNIHIHEGILKINNSKYANIYLSSTVSISFLSFKYEEKFFSMGLGLYCNVYTAWFKKMDSPRKSLWLEQ